DRLAQRIGVISTGLRETDGLARELRGPAGHVADDLATVDQVGIADVGDRLAVVEGFELGELVTIFLDQLGELPHQLGAIAAGHRLPGAALEGRPRGRDRGVDVGRIALGNPRDDTARARVEGLEGLAGFGIDPAAADEQLVLAREEVRSRLAQLWVKQGY